MDYKIVLLPLFLLTMCAPAPVTPLEVTDIDMERIFRMVDEINFYKVKETRTEPSDAINNALVDFWEKQDGSNDPSK